MHMAQTNKLQNSAGNAMTFIASHEYNTITNR